MRVLLVTGTFPPGQCGIGDYVSRLAESLASRDGIEVAVLTQVGAHSPVPGVEVLPVAGHWRLAEMKGLLRTVRNWRPDVVHIHYPSRVFGASLLPTLLPVACKLLGLRVVQTWHEPWPLRETYRAVIQRVATDGLLFVRPNYRELLEPVLRPLLWLSRSRIIRSAGALPVSRMTEQQRDALRSRYVQGANNLVVFFGFLYASKGVEQLFDIADPQRDVLVLAGSAPDPVYLDKLKALAAERGWAGRLIFTGHLPPEEASDLLFAADAVVLPFLEGGGDWNTSIHAALDQGTLVITTAMAPAGDDPARNLYTARISDVHEMKRALGSLAGRRAAALPENRWIGIARSHVEFYRSVLPQSAR